MQKNLVINDIDCAALFPRYGAAVGYKKVHGSAGGTMLDGSTTEDVIAVKAEIELNFIPQDEATMTEFLERLYSAPYASVTYFDPRTGAERTIEAIYSEMQVQHLFENILRNEIWHMHSITLTER